MAAPLIKQAGSRGAGIFAEISKGLGAWLPSIREASKKAGGSSKNKRKRTPGKHRGPKKYEGDYVEPGMLLCRQLGLKYYPGENVGVGRDLTLFALERGHVIMSTEKLSPNPISPLYPAVKAGEEVYKRFFNVIPDSQQQVFKLVTQT